MVEDGDVKDRLYYFIAKEKMMKDYRKALQTEIHWIAFFSWYRISLTLETHLVHRTNQPPSANIITSLEDHPVKHLERMSSVKAAFGIRKQLK